MCSLLFCRNLGRGTRRIDQYFEVINIATAKTNDNVDVNTTKDITRHIGMWELRKGYIPCDAALNSECRKPIFNSEDNDAVPQTPPGRVLNHDIVGLQVLAIVIAFVAILSFAWFCFNRDVEIVRKAYCGMFPVICLGTLIIAARLYLSAITPTDEICVARLVFLYNGLCSFWGPVVLSSVRARRLLHEREKYTKYTIKFLQGTMAMIDILILLICLLFSAGMQNYVLTLADTNEPNRNDSYATCEYRVRATGALIMILHVFMLLWGLREAYLAKDIHDKMQETRVSYYVLLLFIATVFVLYPVYIMSEDSKLQMFTIVEYNMGAIFLVCFLIIVGQKTYVVYFGEVEEDVVKTVRTLTRNSLSSSKQISVATVLQSLSQDGKMSLCRQQITMWIVALAKLEDPAKGSTLEQFKELGYMPRIQLSSLGEPIISWNSLHFAVKRRSSSERGKFVLEDIKEEE